VGRAVLPLLNDLVGPDDAGKVAKELTSAIADSRRSSDAEDVRSILFRYPRTKGHLLEAMPEAEEARSFGGGGGGRLWR
jgi:hypothetical protein